MVYLDFVYSSDSVNLRTFFAYTQISIQVDPDATNGIDYEQ